MITRIMYVAYYTGIRLYCLTVRHTQRIEIFTERNAVYASTYRHLTRVVIVFKVLVPAVFLWKGAAIHLDTTFLQRTYSTAGCVTRTQ